ncbi:hypothetical protein M1328_03150 [Patescibacteria group bacterium]|nr:hypothetical protein [Patescibacteria group bacterium]
MKAEIVSIIQIKERLKSPMQKNIFDFLLKFSHTPFSDNNGIGLKILNDQSYRGETGEINRHGRNFFRCEFNPLVYDKSKDQATLAVYFFDNGKTDFRLTKPTESAEIMAEEDSLAGIPSTGKRGEDLKKLEQYLNINKEVLLAGPNPPSTRSMILTEKDGPESLVFKLRRGSQNNRNRTIHGSIKYINGQKAY